MSLVRVSSALAFTVFSPGAANVVSSRVVSVCKRQRPNIAFSTFVSSSSSSQKSCNNTAKRSLQMTATVPSTPTTITGPKWVLEYEGLDTPGILADLNAAEKYTKSVAENGDKLKKFIPTAREIDLKQAKSEDIPNIITSMTRDFWDAVTLLRNIATEANCVASCDGTNNEAKKMSSSMQVKFSSLRQAYEPASLFLDLCSDEIFDTIVTNSEDELMVSSEYILSHSRKMKEHKLSLEEENILTTMGVTGHSAWGTLYTDLSTTLSVDLEMPDGSMKSMGIASADAMRDDKDEKLRKASWQAIRKAWIPHQETCTAALNAITGWRNDLYKKRNLPSFLYSTLHQNRMSQATLDALLEAIDTDGVEVGRKALKVQAQSLGMNALNPWDLFAPAPVNNEMEKIYSYEDGINLIADAVGEIDEEAGAFVRMMRDNKWIEASRGDTKRPGAYCTGFSKSRTPRVYLSDYNGGAQLLLTLAHELGHAFHSWVMRDLPVSQLSYPMNLAETASIFFETVVGNKLVEQATNDEERFGMLWGDAESAGAFLLNIPARYRFEEELNERRVASGPLSSIEVDDMMVRAWKRYYGDTLTDDQIENVGVFSQSKLHFYLTGISFYNWPYSFGFLYALGVYARYQKMKENPSTSNIPFSQVYKDLLRDTGRMDTEDVVKKHLGADVEDAQFWKDAIAVSGAKVDKLQEMAKAIGKI